MHRAAVFQESKGQVIKSVIGLLQTLSKEAKLKRFKSNGLIGCCATVVLFS